MAKKTIVSETWSEKVDKQTGELLELEHSEGTRTIYTQEPPYIKFYIQDLLYMRDMPKGLTNIVYTLLQYATYADKGLRVYLPTGLKNELMGQLGVNRQVFNNSLTKLCKGQIIRRVDTGVYELNPYFFGKGEWKDIDRIRATWEYSAIDGRTFQGQIIQKDGTVQAIGQTTEAPADNLTADDTAGASHPVDQKKQEDKAS